MAKLRTVFRCTECGGTSPKWAGRCPSCEAWNTLSEEVEAPRPVAALTAIPADRPLPIGEVDVADWVSRPTGIGELDRVLGGGLVPGSVTLVGGEPGIGKSTLLLQMAAAQAAAGARVLYVSAEESKQQVRLRAERLGAMRAQLYLVAEQSIGHIEAHIDEVKPDVVIVDSIQTVYDTDLGSAPGTVVQVRESAHRLTQVAKSGDISIVLVGHVTKDGSLAGPRVLEHVVDTVLNFEGDRHHALRMLRASKHRFGPTQELGLFEMGEGGMTGVPDASGLFLADRRQGLAGSVVVPTMDGFRPLLVEIQALGGKSSLPSPRRSAQGLDSGRLSMILAVLTQRVGFLFDGIDIYALAAGGVKVVEPGADLALAMAITSSTTGAVVRPDVVVCGEIGLGGEVRQVAQTPQRLAEAARLGFTEALVPQSAILTNVDGLRLTGVATVAEAVEALNLYG